MEWLAFLLGGSLGSFFWAVSFWLGSRHANGDPVRFSQYHSGFFKAVMPRRRVHCKNPFVRA
jgi:hypothetical protein